MKRPNDSRGCSGTNATAPGEQGFTLLETVIALVIMMIVSLGVASLFAYSINYNSGANDRTLAHAVAQQQMERLRRSAFTDASLTTSATNTIVSAGRSYTVQTTICAAAGCGGSATLKKITVDVTPQSAGANWVRTSVRIETLRAVPTTGAYFQ